MDATDDTQVAGFADETKSYDDIDITDDFMFSYIMRQPDICIGLLECLFP